jgi:hypothetical protein
MRQTSALITLAVLLVILIHSGMTVALVFGFVPNYRLNRGTYYATTPVLVAYSITTRSNDEFERSSRLEECNNGSSEKFTQTVVSSLTSMLNRFQWIKDDVATNLAQKQSYQSPVPFTTAPYSPEDLLHCIYEDYVDRNYLWTGNINLMAYDAQCQFTDPTISFVGTDQFVQNIQNLRPVVNYLAGEIISYNSTTCRSILLSIQLHKDKGFIETRWNMVGELNRLPWKPKIDVIGHTRFWYQMYAYGSGSQHPFNTIAMGHTEDASIEARKTEACYRVLFYDEEWELSPLRALFQLISPAGTVPNSENSIVDIM